MKILAVSDIHRDLVAARALVERAQDVDVVVGAGDFATMRRGLEEVIEVLADIDTPTVVVPGNGESHSELAAACEGWDAAHVLHGSDCTIQDVPFFGLGAAVPVTPFGSWSYDLSEDEAALMLADMPPNAIFVTHSPPRGHGDLDTHGNHLGSTAVLDALVRTRPRLVVCGHIHASWGHRSDANGTLVVNAGPSGVLLELTWP